MITLASDFGSPYPAAMRGVILSRTDARLVDIAHDLPRQDVRAAAFWLRETLPWFPPAVHLAVIDPGVGTDRTALVIRSGDHALVGPDNGVLIPAARELGSEGTIEAFTIADEDPESSTFHGRDVFAPAAAIVHEAGVETFHERSAFSPAETFEDLTFPEPTVGDDRATGEVLVIDGFGNAITTIPGSVLADHMGSSVQVNGMFARAVRSYAAVDPGHRLVTVGSHGNVELAVNQGRGERAFGVDAGSRVRVEW